MRSFATKADRLLLSDAHGPALSKVELDAIAKVSVCVVVVTCNSESWVSSFLSGVAQQTQVAREVVVVDNGSTDATLSLLKSQSRCELTIFPEQENTGYAAACNRGIRYAASKNHNYVLVMNPDVTLLPWAVAEMISVSMDSPGLGPISPLHLSHCPGQVERGCLWFLGLSEEFRRDAIMGAPLRRYYTTDFVNGAVMLLPMDLIRDVGEFDELFYFYGEDNDLCRRSCLLGRSPAVAVRARAYHWHATVCVKDRSRDSQRRRANYRLIIKKPTRSLWLNLCAFVSKAGLDLLSACKNRKEILAVLQDCLVPFREVRALAKSRRENLRLAASR